MKIKSYHLSAYCYSEKNDLECWRLTFHFLTNSTCSLNYNCAHDILEVNVTNHQFRLSRFCAQCKSSLEFTWPMISHCFGVVSKQTPLSNLLIDSSLVLLRPHQKNRVKPPSRVRQVEWKQMTNHGSGTKEGNNWRDSFKINKISEINKSCLNVPRWKK